MKAHEYGEGFQNTQKKLATQMNIDLFFCKNIACSLLVSLVVIGEKKQLGENKLAVFLLLVVVLLAIKGMEILGLAVF